MKPSSIFYLSWLALLSAFALWAGVGYFVKTVLDEQTAYADRVTIAEEEVLSQEAQLRLHALARETRSEREALERIAEVDVLGILEILEKASRDIRVPFKIDQALSAPKGGTLVHSSAFTVQAEGSFAQMMQVAALLESLPIPSTLTEVHLEQVPPAEGSKTKTPSWKVIAHLQFLTTGDIGL